MGGALAVQVGFYRTTSVADATTITNLVVLPIRPESVHVREAVAQVRKQHCPISDAMPFSTPWSETPELR